MPLVPRSASRHGSSRSTQKTDDGSAGGLTGLLEPETGGGGGAGSAHLEIMAFYGMGVYNIEQMALGKEGGGPAKQPWVTHLMEGRYSDQVRAFNQYSVPSFYGKAPWAVGAAKLPAQSYRMAI